MKKTKYVVFYAKQLPSGFFAIFANGHKEFLNASLKGVDKVRTYIDYITKVSKITNYALTFDESSYNYYLEEYAKFY